MMPYQCYLKHPEKVIVGDEIPKNIFQTWKDKKLTPGMQKAVDSWKRENPSWTYSFFDDLGQRKFIESYFREDVLNTFDNLIPGAYKADLWRYCVLYVLGGVYVDIKLYASVDLESIIKPQTEFVVCKDGYKSKITGNTDYYLYQAFLGSLPKNPVLGCAIDMIVANGKLGYYGTDYLLPTGPGLLGKAFNRERGKLSSSQINAGSYKIDNSYYEILPEIRNGIAFSENDIKLFRLNYKGYSSDKRKYVTPYPLDISTIYTLCWEIDNVYKNGLIQRDEAKRQRLRRLRKGYAGLARTLYKKGFYKDARNQAYKVIFSRYISWRIIEIYIVSEVKRLIK